MLDLAIQARTAGIPISRLIRPHHILEAIHYRWLDRNCWERM